MKTLKQIHEIKRSGIIDVTCSVNDWLAYSVGGEVNIFDIETKSPLCIIVAHKSPVAALKFNEDGTLLATSSDRGTLIRVFAVPSGNLLNEFRRGSYASNVYSLAFDLGSKLLGVSSSTQTVHIYNLESEVKDKWFSKHRDFAYFKLPLKASVRTLIIFPPLTNNIYTIAETGELFIHKINVRGGEFKLLEKFCT